MCPASLSRVTCDVTPGDFCGLHIHSSWQESCFSQESCLSDLRVGASLIRARLVISGILNRMVVVGADSSTSCGCTTCQSSSTTSTRCSSFSGARRSSRLFHHFIHRRVHSCTCTSADSYAHNEQCPRQWRPCRMCCKARVHLRVHTFRIVLVLVLVRS